MAGLKAERSLPVGCQTGWIPFGASFSLLLCAPLSQEGERAKARGRNADCGPMPLNYSSNGQPKNGAGGGGGSRVRGEILGRLNLIKKCFTKSLSQFRSVSLFQNGVKYFHTLKLAHASVYNGEGEE